MQNTIYKEAKNKKVEMGKIQLKISMFDYQNMLFCMQKF